MTKTVFSLIKKIPSVRKKIEAEVKKTRQQIEMEIQSTHVGTFVVHLPEQGLSEVGGKEKAHYVHSQDSFIVT